MISMKIPLTGYEVDADLYEGSNNEVYLILIGYTSDRVRYQEFAEIINSELNASVLVLEYSGHGESPYELGEISPAQHFLEVITVYDWLKDKYSEKDINVIGTSYGAFMATQLTKYRTFPKLVLRVPAIYPPNVFYDKLKTFDKNLHFQDYRHNTKDLHEHPLLKRTSEFPGKTLVVTHELDTICPPNETGAFTKAFGADTWEAEGLKHGFADSDVTDEQKKEYFLKITDWLK